VQQRGVVVSRVGGVDIRAVHQHQFDRRHEQVTLQQDAECSIQVRDEGVVFSAPRACAGQNTLTKIGEMYRQVCSAAILGAMPQVGEAMLGRCVLCGDAWLCLLS
jgi:hypothetical protein